MNTNPEQEARRPMTDFTGLLHTTMPLAAALGMTAHEFTPDRTILELE